MSPAFFCPGAQRPFLCDSAVSPARERERQKTAGAWRERKTSALSALRGQGRNKSRGIWALEVSNCFVVFFCVFGVHRKEEGPSARVHTHQEGRRMTPLLYAPPSLSIPFPSPLPYLEDWVSYLARSSSPLSDASAMHRRHSAILADGDAWGAPTLPPPTRELRLNEDKQRRLLFQQLGAPVSAHIPSWGGHLVS